MNLRRAPSVQRALVIEHLGAHERHQRAAEDYHDVAPAEQRIPNTLENGGERFVGLAEVLKFVDDDDEPLFRCGCLGEKGEQIIPSFERGLGDEGVPQIVRHHVVKGHAVLALRFLGRKIVQRRLVSAELVDKGRFPYPASTVDDDERGLFAAILSLQCLHLGVAIDKTAHAPSQLTYPISQIAY